MSQQKKTIPKKINLLGRVIDVELVSMKDGEFGEYEQHKYLIKINKKSSYAEAKQTLFHEAIHAALHISGLSMVIPTSENTDLEEALVVCLENAFGDIVNIDKLELDK